MKTSTFWKGELGIRASVEEGDQQYTTELLIKGSQIFDYSCSCVVGNSHKEMCVHAKLVWEEWKRQNQEQKKRPTSTSQEVRTMIREYTNREVAQIICEGEEGKIRLVPRLIVNGGSVSLEFSLGKERLYVLKDLAGFVRAMETGAQLSYGKKLDFPHSIDAFVEQDRPLCRFLEEVVDAGLEREKQGKSSYTSVRELRRISLSLAGRDRFFALMDGRKLEIEQKGSSRLRLVSHKPLSLTLKLERTGLDGVLVQPVGELSGFPGKEGWYLDDGQELVCLEAETAKQMRIFLAELLGDGKNKTLIIQERDMPLFYERVLKKLMPFVRLELQDVDLESFRPKELRARFYFDSSRPGELRMRPELSYGDYTFEPVEDEKVPRSICRDVPGEFRISKAITRYFRYRDDASRELVIRDDEEALYRLLSEGVSELSALGEVFFTEKAQEIRLMPPPRLRASIRLTDGWLELGVDAEGLSRKQLAQILAAYDPNRPYCRLEDGSLMQVDEDGLAAVARLADGVMAGRRQLAECIRLPAYRALYLDAVLKEDRSITCYRDQLFKALVRGMKSVEDSEFEIPSRLQPILRSYQKTGFRWMRTLDQYGFGGILADDMGLGKTLQVITLLTDEQERCPESVSLVICPASLVYNWEHELHTFAPWLKAVAVTGTAAERQALVAERTEADVLITSYDLLKRDLEVYQDIEFRFHILDEAQYIKNPATQTARAAKQIRSRTRFALTGTPVENRLGELWSIFDFLMPGFLFSYAAFRRRFEIPVLKEESQEPLHDLHRLTAPFILRRLKQEVLKELPGKLESIVYSQAEGEQRTLYAACAAQLREYLQGEAGLGDVQVLAGLTRLRQLCCDPALCTPHYKGGSAKLEACLELIEGAIQGGHKILLFSQFASMLERIRRRLDRAKISCHLLTGATTKEERIRMAGEFQTDQVPVFLISLKAGGTGLNLTAADVVIHYDPWWNLAAQNQATDRAHRIGQKKQVSVIRLIMKHTIEENMVKLQKQKEYLANQVVMEGNVPLSSLTREELLELLE